MGNLYDKASLVMIPSQYKEGKLYNIKPLKDSFEFERGSASTRVNSDGLIETLHDEATNFLLQSNQFDTTWSVFDLNPPTNGFAGYDGSNDAWLLQENTDNDEHYIRQSSGITSGIGTFSFFAKKKDYDFIQFSRSGDGSEFANFNINNGTIGNYSGSLINVNIESKGNGWYRCSVTYSFGANAFVGIALIRSDVSSRYETYLGNGTNGTYIQDAQLESGYFATPYIDTTTEAVTQVNRHDTPRLDYSGTEPFLLLEPQRTNEIDYSEDFITSFWNLSVGTRTVGEISPTGDNSATRVNFTGGGGRFFRRTNVSLDANKTYTASWYIKNINLVGTPNMQIETQSGGGTGSVNIDVNNSYGTLSTDEFTRQTITFTTGNAAGVYRIRVINAGAVNDTNSFIIWGMQLEQGSYATSYIPTNGQTNGVTRLADAIATKDITNIITGDNFTWFLDLGDWQGSNSTNNELEISSSNNIKIQLRVRADGYRFYYFNIQGGTQFPVGGSTTANKFCVSYDGQNYRLYRDGVKVDTTSSVGDTGWNEFTNRGGLGPTATTPLKSMVMFPEALTDEECIKLTTI